MFSFLLFILLIFVLLFILLFISMILSEEKNNSFFKMTGFDCGFTSLKKSRVSFSIQFFLVGIIFIIFDMEIILLINILMVINFSKSLFLNFLFFLWFLFFGLLIEWKENKLVWYC